MPSPLSNSTERVPTYRSSTGLPLPGSQGLTSRTRATGRGASSLLTRKTLVSLLSSTVRKKESVHERPESDHPTPTLTLLLFGAISRIRVNTFTQQIPTNSSSPLEARLCHGSPCSSTNCCRGSFWSGTASTSPEHGRREGWVPRGHQVDTLKVLKTVVHVIMSVTV